MGFRGRLEITDGTTSIDILGRSGKNAFSLLEWQPSFPDIKGGGIWMDNPLIDGRQLAIRKETNIIDIFNLNVKGQTQADVFGAITALRNLLNKATQYWTNGNRIGNPVYLLIQYPHETYPSWAMIQDFKLSKLENPFVSPLINEKSATIAEWQLTIEHGYRSPVTGLICAEIDFQWSEASLNSQSITSSPTVSGDDCEIRIRQEFVTIVQTNAVINQAWNEEYRAGIRFRNVAIPANATILRARIEAIEFFGPLYTAPNMYVFGEKNVAPALFVDYADYLARVPTDTEVLLPATDFDATTAAGSLYYISNNWGIEDVIQEIVNLPGWASGNDLVLFIRPEGGYNNARSITSVDDLVWNPALLRVWYESGVARSLVVRDTTCQGVIIGNQEKFNDIGTVFQYDDGTATYTDLSALAMPWNLLPAIPAVGDAVYIACDDAVSSPDDEPFYSVIFEIAQAASGVTIDFQYWNSGAGAWQALPGLDNTFGLTKTGKNSLHWDVSAITGWAKNAVNGVTAFWIRGYVSAVSATPVGPTQNGDNTLYTCGKPYILAKSDYPAKAKLTINPVGTYNEDAYTIDEVWLATRSVNRGSNFTPFLNLVTEQLALPVGIIFTGLSGSNTALNTAPTGYARRYNPGGVVAEANRFYLRITNTIASEYSGKFRVFLRRYGATNPENMSYRLKVATGVGSTPVYYQTGLISDTDNPNYTIIDFGVIDLTSIAVQFSDIYLIVSSAASAACDVYWTDLILFPVDQLFIHSYQRIGPDIANPSVGYKDNETIIDSTGIEDISSYMAFGGSKINSYLYESNAKLAFDAMDNDTAIWFFFGTYITGCTNYQRRYSPGIIASIKLQLLPEII